MKEDHGLPAINQDLVGKRKPGPGRFVWSLKTVRDRCEVVGDCWLWKQATINGFPQASINGHGGTMVRRWVWELVNGPIKGCKRVVAIDECRDRLCCNPEHLKLASVGKVLKKAWAEGGRNKLRQTENLRTRAAAMGWCKLTQAQADSIRVDPRDAIEVAAEYGISRRHVYSIRNGKNWSAGRVVNSVFALGASA